MEHIVFSSLLLSPTVMNAAGHDIGHYFPHVAILASPLAASWDISKFYFLIHEYTRPCLNILCTGYMNKDSQSWISRAAYQILDLHFGFCAQIRAHVQAFANKDHAARPLSTEHDLWVVFPSWFEVYDVIPCQVVALWPSAHASKISGWSYTLQLRNSVLSEKLHGWVIIIIRFSEHLP